ncbi:MAG TPA: hypothetical protein VFF79_20220 [Conexibacter sp.]|jgi:hypothetical protein|nr:hypothetical protein [Conexibacter sp.]
MRKRRGRTAGLVVLALAAIGVLAVVALGSGDPQPSAAPSFETVPVTARAPIGALLRPASSGRDAIPPAVARQKIMRDAIDPASARVVRAIGRRVWLTRSLDGGSVCVVAAGSLSCSHVEEIARRGLGPALAYRAGGPVHVSGIASDDVKTVDVTLADGPVRTVAVAGNFLALDVPRMPRAMSWVGPRGRETFRFPRLRG